MEKKAEWALVTGVSKGIGFLYAEELLKMGYNIIGVSRDTSSCSDLIVKYPHRKIELFNLDLSQVENAYYLHKRCTIFNVTLVINNAGYGVWGNFITTKLERELNMIALNICSLQVLTKLFLKDFISSNNGKIINIASVASFAPGPSFSSYYASKAYVLSLSVAINTELKLQNQIPRVITICPGPLRTNFWQNALENSKDIKNIHSSGFPPVMETRKFVIKSLQKALKTKTKNYITVGFWNNLMIFLAIILPKKWVLKKIYKYQSQKNSTK